MDSFMRVSGVRTGLMVKAVSDTLQNYKIPNATCSVERSINLQGKIGALYSNNKTKNSITAFGETTVWAREVL
jgi:ribosome-interacting GTPase 1